MNLPSDAGPHVRSPVTAPAPPASKLPLVLGMAPGLLGTAVGIAWALLEPLGRKFDLPWFDALVYAALVFAPLLPFSLGGALVAFGVRGGRLLPALGRWALGLVGGVTIGVAVIAAWFFAAGLFHR